jgi:hypothetical protein
MAALWELHWAEQLDPLKDERKVEMKAVYLAAQ